MVRSAYTMQAIWPHSYLWRSAPCEGDASGLERSTLAAAGAGRRHDREAKKGVEGGAKRAQSALAKRDLRNGHGWFPCFVCPSETVLPACTCLLRTSGPTYSDLVSIAATWQERHTDAKTLAQDGSNPQSRPVNVIHVCVIGSKDATMVEKDHKNSPPSSLPRPIF